MARQNRQKKKSGRDWKSLRQAPTRKPGTRIAWWRRAKIRFHTVALCLAGTCGFAFLVVAVSYFTSNPLEVNLAGPSGTVDVIDFQTNGSLGKAWAVKTLDIPKETRLMDLNLHALKKRIESEGQVSSVILQRRYPHMLRIKVTEHLPILKIYIADPELGKKCLLVSESGVVFEGIGQPEQMVGGLPILFGGKLLKDSEGFLPLKVVSKIKPLLDAARKKYPHIFRDWNRIRYESLEGQDALVGLVRINSPLAKEVIFSTEMDFMTQLERLDYVLNYSNREGWTPLSLVDLPGRKSATVRLSGEMPRTIIGQSQLF